MKDIIEVKQNWPDDLMRIDLTLSNICNYKCWYCFPGCNDGSYSWPDFDVFVKNLSHLLDYYKANTNKKKFDFHIMGGEVTHWKRFFDLIVYFKERYDCIFTLTTNASKKLDWWKKAAPYLDYVTISSHHEYADISHVRNVADFLYKKNVIVNVVVLMDPFAWDKCIDTVEFYKKSKHRWSIRYLEIITQDSVKYTSEQLEVLKTLRARRPNIFWFLRNNKSYKSKVKVIDVDNKTHSIQDQEIILNRKNNFFGWECNLGVDWIAIKMDGTVSGICTNGLYKDIEKFNVFNSNFIETFRPTIGPTICQQTNCWCAFETNMPKRLSNISTKKVIPIYANRY
jgi:MoaA/NifB/PqqE/SkfB family radical SAM enzyme